MLKITTLVALNISLSAFQLLLLGIATFGAGYFFRTKQLRKKQGRILELENEMVQNHAEILRMQQELSLVKRPAKTESVPVVAFKQEPGADSSSRKKNA